MTTNKNTLPVYKINHLINQDTIDTIYVFRGNIFILYERRNTKRCFYL